MARCKFLLAMLFVIGVMLFNGAFSADAYVVTAGLWEEKSPNQDTDVIHFADITCSNGIDLYIYDPDSPFSPNHLVAHLTPGGIGATELWFTQDVSNNWIVSTTRGGDSVLNLGTTKVFGLYFEDTGTDPGYTPSATIQALGADTYRITDFVAPGETGPCASFILTDVQAVPIPGAAWLLGSGLLGLLGVRRRS